MTNIFQRIGNKLEKNKEEKKSILDKYWKLSTLNRIDYDNKINKIHNDYKSDFLLLTYTWLKGLLCIAIFLGAFGLIFNSLDTMLTTIRLIWKVLIQFIWVPIFMDVMLMFITPIVEERLIKELNKRFKLC